MSTIKDVASKAGVSVGTVSNYINKTKPVNNKIGIKIENAIEELRYVLNKNAQSLKKSSSYEIAVILPNIQNQYYNDIYIGIEKEFQNTDYFINLSFNDEIPDKEVCLITNYIKKQIDGIMLVSTQPENTEFFTDVFFDNKIPIVFLEREIKNYDANFVSFDNKATIYGITNSLIHRECHKIALITGPETYSSESDCIEGYINAHDDNKCHLDRDLIIYTNLTKEDAFRSALELFRENKPEVIITSSEEIAEGVLEAAHICGVDVSKDMKVITLGQEYWNKYGKYPNVIRTSRTAVDLGSAAAKLLKQNMDSPVLFETQKILFKDNFDNRILEANDKMILKPSAGKDRKRIKVLFLDTSEVKAFSGLIPYFTEKYNVDVEFKTCPQNLLKDRIITEADKCIHEADVFMYDIPWLYYLASNDYLADITEYIYASGLNLDIYLPGSFKYYSEYKSRYYGLPFLYSPQLLFYRKDIFSDKKLQREFEDKYMAKLIPPRTWLEFNAVSEFFTRELNPESPVEYGVSLPLAYFEIMAPELHTRLWAYGGEIFDKNNKVILDSPENKKAFTTFVNVLKTSPGKIQEQTIEKTVSDFCQGKTAMLITYASHVTILNNRFLSNIIGKIGYDTIPGRSPMLGGWSLGISPFSKNKEAAFDFISWACGEQIGAYYTILEGQSPLVSLYKNNDLLKLYPWLPLIYDTYNLCNIRKSPIKQGGTIIPHDKMEYLICKQIYSAIEGTATITEALKHAQKDLEVLFEEFGYRQ